MVQYQRTLLEMTEKGLSCIYLSSYFITNTTAWFLSCLNHLLFSFGFVCIFCYCFFSWTGYNTSSSPTYHFNKTVNNAGSSFDEDRHARNFLCLVPSIIVNKTLQLDDEVEGMLFWREKDNPFPKSLGNEVLIRKTLWQSADGELPNKLLLALGAGNEADFPNIYRLLVIACTLLKFWPNPDQVKNLQTSLLKSLQIPGERNTEQRNFLSWAI